MKQALRYSRLLMRNFLFPNTKTWFITFSILLINHWALAQAPIYKENGVYKVRSYYTPAGLDAGKLAELEAINNSPLTTAQQEDFWKRSTEQIDYYKRIGGYGNTFLENEKASYPYAMHSIIYGIANDNPAYITPAIKFLEENATQDVGSNYTELIDFYPCFTLKGQVPKYFYFGKYNKNLSDSYVERMYKAFGLLTMDGNTPVDPWNRPHPLYDPSLPTCATGTWDVRCVNSWVSTRDSDNLKAMRETSVYLFAEEIGNEMIRLLYKERIKGFVAALYHIGWSEWDSESYLAHTVAPYMNLYTYTQDPEVKKLAKAGLDWMFAAGAAKYYRGLLAGPSRRVTNDATTAFGSGAVSLMHHYFGSPVTNPKLDGDRDSYIGFLCNYRPPQALYSFSNKDFKKGLEQLNTKPTYGARTPNADVAPETWETMYYGQTYQFGSASVADGTTRPVLGGIGPNGIRLFKLGAYNSQRGADCIYICASTDGKLKHDVLAGSQLTQYQNLMLYMRKADSTKFVIQAPKAIPPVQEGNFWFLKLEKTWVAFRLINLQHVRSEAAADSALSGEQLHVFEPTNTDGYAGLAMEVGEEGEFADFEAFKAAVQTNSMDLSQLASGTIKLTGANGQTLGMTYNTMPKNDIPTIYRNSDEAFDRQKNMATYKAFAPPTAEITDISLNPDKGSLLIKAKAEDLLRGLYQDWKQGTLKVISNDYVFTSSVSVDGVVNWNEVPATQANTLGKLKAVEFYEGNNKIGEITDELQLASGELNFNWGHNGSKTYSIKAKVIDADGDIGWSAEKVYTLTGLSLTQTALSAVHVYPNPASDYLQLDFPPGFQTCKISLSDLHGREVYAAENKESKQLHCPIAGLKKGIYILHLQATGTFCHKKIIIE